MFWRLLALIPLAAGCGGRQAAPAMPTPVTPRPPAPSSPVAAPSPSDALAALGARIWEWTLDRSPEFGTTIGDDRRDDRLSDLSDAGQGRTAQEAQELRTALHEIDPAALAGQERVSWEILDRNLANVVDAYRLGFHLWRIDHLFGIHLSFPALIRQEHPRRNARDLENLLARYRGYARQLDDTSEDLRRGLARGLVGPQESCKRVLHQLDQEIARPAAERTLAVDAATLPAVVPEAARAELARAMNDVLAREIIPALGRMRALLVDEILPRTRPEVGLWTLPNGTEAYAFLIQQHTSTTLSAQQIHDTGRRELESIEAEMRTIASRLGHHGLLSSFSTRIRHDRHNFLGSRDELLAAFQSIHERAWQALPRAFGRLPAIRSEVKPMAAFLEEDSPAAYYNPPNEDGSRPGIFYANLYEPETRPRYNMEALTFHEDVPGHHLQIALATELRDLPPYRRHADFNVFAEGWGVYAERLADELGLYSSDLSRYGMLSFQAWRASRLVIDTGIHQLHWSRQQGIDFLTEHSALPPNEVENEVDRYVVWPGQALSYMIGALEIRRIRQAAETRLGRRFNLKDFHDVVLGSGAVPMSTLDRIVAEWSAARAD